MSAVPEPARGSLRPIAVLSAAAFLSAATMRAGDPLVPLVAEELALTPGRAGIIVTAFALAYGLCQFLWGPLGDRLGKYRVVATMTLVSAATVAAAAFAHSLAGLTLARLVGGMTAAAIIPLSMAYIGDQIPYEQRQAVLARFLSGQILGLISGQALAGVFADLLGWRGVFILLGGLYLVVGGLLLRELRSGRVPAATAGEALGPSIILGRYRDLLRRSWPVTILVTVFLEGAAFFGSLTFVGAHLRLRFGLGYSLVGLLLGCLGLGGLLYAASASRLVPWLKERGLALFGTGLIVLGLAILAFAPHPAFAAPAMTLMGLGFYMLHGTLQTNATQMAPAMRGLAVSAFASCFFLGQALGVWLAGQLADRLGFPALFATSALCLLALGLVFTRQLAHRPAG